MEYHSDIKDANFPTDAEGRTYHLDVKKGEIAPRIITCGDFERLFSIIKTPGFELKFIHQAPRLFTIATGLYYGVPFSVITSLMGQPNTDFVLNEARYCVQGPMAMIRLGTCGSPAEEIAVGDVTAPFQTRTVLRIPDAIHNGKTELKDIYYISQPFQGNKQLVELLQNQIKDKIGKVHIGDHISCDSFYSSQGRVTGLFDDKNEGLVDYFVEQIPNLKSIEMETSTMFDLAERSSIPIYCAGAHIVVAQRKSNDFITNEKKHDVEHKLGLAAFEALKNFKIENVQDNYEGAVWMNEKVTGDENLLKKCGF